MSIISYWALSIPLVISICAFWHSRTNRKALRLLLRNMPQNARYVLDRAYDGKQGYDV